MRELKITRPGVFVPVRPDPTGREGPTRDQVRGRAWRRTSRGLYVPSTVDSQRLEQRIVEAAAGQPDDALVTGWAALAWLGAAWFDGFEPDGVTPRPVPVALGDRRTASAREGVILSEDWLFDSDAMECDGLPLTAPERSVSYEARRARTLHHAVEAIDIAAAFDLVDLESLSRYTTRLPARQGIRQFRHATDLGDENVWSPQEPFMRLAWTDAGLPRPLTNRPVFDLSGRHLFTPDLFDPDAGVAGEYDGALHSQTRHRRRDLDREELYRSYGIEVVTMISTDRRDSANFARRLHAAYRRAAQRSGGRRWTLDLPDWWVDTSTVARRRALEGDDRAVWLRHRAAWRRRT